MMPVLSAIADALRLLTEPVAMAWRLHGRPPWLGTPRCWFVCVPGPGDEAIVRQVRSLSEYLAVTACLPDDARHFVGWLPVGRVYDLTPRTGVAS